MPVPLVCDLQLHTLQVLLGLNTLIYLVGPMCNFHLPIAVIVFPCVVFFGIFIPDDVIVHPSYIGMVDASW